LFLPFVENALKYGTHPNRESNIHISLKSSQKKIHFSVKNPIFNDKKVVSTQTGLENVKRRLHLLYPNKHTLRINDTVSGQYEVHLELVL
jgi:LytS/YehU family sensor histidine kinase